MPLRGLLLPPSRPLRPRPRGPCPTFRPDTPRGLVPPRQPALLMRAAEPPPRSAVVGAADSDLDESHLFRVPAGQVRGPLALRLTVLGKSPSWQDAGGACSGYLIEDGETNRPARLRQRRLRQAPGADRLRRSRRRRHLPPARRPLPRPRPLLLRADLRAQAAAGPGPHLAGHRQPRPPAADRPAGRDRGLPPGGRRLGQRRPDRVRVPRSRSTSRGPGRDRGIEASFHPVPHFIETFAVNLSAGGGELVYSADTRPGDELVEIARDADLLIVEATLPRPERTGVRGHLTPRRPASTPARAGAKRVVITHISDELGDEWAREQAERGFGGPVEVAARGRGLRGLAAPGFHGRSCSGGGGGCGLGANPATMTAERDPVRRLRPDAREMDELLGDFWDQAGYRQRRGGRVRPAVDVYYCGDDARRRRSSRSSCRDRAGRGQPRGPRAALVISGERPVRETEGRRLSAGRARLRPVPPHRRAPVDVAAERGSGHLRGRDPPGRAAAARCRMGRQVPIERAE